MTTGILDSGATFNIFDNLVSRQRDNQLHPSLAREWKLLQPTVWQFRLRPDLKWHNGDGFSSVDVKFSIERTFDPSAQTVVATVFNTVDRVEIPDPLSVLFHTKKPDLLLPAAPLGHGREGALYRLPSAVVIRATRDWASGLDSDVNGTSTKWAQR